MSDNMSMTVRRAVIEANIERCRDAAVNNLIEIGKWLNAAKAEGVVGHGEWAAWVAEHAGMNERTAQRAMQFARELPEDSPIARMGTAKISALLTLPAGEREAFAEKIDAEHASSREVEMQVKAARAERDEALRLVSVQKEKLRRIPELERTIEQKDSLIRNGEIGQKRSSRLLGEAQERANQLHVDLLASESERIRLAAELEEARKGSGDSEEVKVLREKLKAREQEIDQLSDALDEAQMSLARTGMVGGSRSDPTATILSAVGALMAEAGKAPAELDQMVNPIDGDTRMLLLTQAYQVKQWAAQIIVKLGGEICG